ncbi:hypothetical protein M011DRAFT_465092 [Sporormia fimetaria CBS 119925]|uniref:Glycosyltransferase 2 n=1 Tax=Sporormia fimetaria CBS 119925 TaxID=1340428 RepID=A0A6A6VI77_9PLEO|nr:hypothetical protein M011DRAFT_465092 [Sporormia fimetaria CBS 119925]
MPGRSYMPADEELGKKDDDHRPTAYAWNIWSRYSIPAWRRVTRWRRRRLLFFLGYFCLLCVLYWELDFLWSAISEPSTGDAASWDPDSGSSSNTYETEPTGPPTGFRAPKNGDLPVREYTGPIVFHRLAPSLRAASFTFGYHPSNRNVLFAVSSLKSVSTLMPIICEMANWNRNHVHVAVMGRVDLPLAALQEINVSKNDACPALWHDARPDYAEYSSDARAESAVSSALSHINEYLHPQAVIVDDEVAEDAFFSKGIRSRAQALRIPIIEIPQGRGQSFAWITRLDADSLRNWHKPNVEIVVSLPSYHSGGVLGLLRSLQEADYSGMKPPRLTVELGSEVDPSVAQFLDAFSWPPESGEASHGSSSLTIRRRITEPKDQEDAAVRFLELYYPNKLADSYILTLTANVELSPLYCHYLKYALLEYRYSTYGERDSVDLLGLSLERPAALLDGNTELPMLRPADMHTSRYVDAFPEETSVPFLSQTVDTHAVLFFGEKWAELHSFARNRIAKRSDPSEIATSTVEISDSLPAWAVLMPELMQLRGYSLLYPAAKGSLSLATVHRELKDGLDEAADSPWTTGRDREIPEQPIQRKPSTETSLIPRSRYLHVALPFHGELPDISHLPYLSSSGEILAPGNASVSAATHADQFRTTVGGCWSANRNDRKIEAGSTDDLFCFGPSEEDDSGYEAVPGAEAEGTGLDPADVAS